jgi:hypothetical protein
MINKLIQPDLRRDVDRHLPRPVTEGEWNLLDIYGHIKRYERSEIDSSGLAEVVKQLRDAVGNPDTVTERHRGGISEKRSAAIEQIVAQEAARDFEVVSFRKTAMRGKLVKPANIEQWIQRQSTKDSIPTNYLRVPVPHGVTLRLNEHGLVPEPPIIVSGDWPAVGSELEILEYATEGSAWIKRQPVARGSVLQQLLFLSKTLAQRYGWQCAQAAGFVLSGIPPELPPLKAEVSIVDLDALSRVKLVVDPTVSPRELASAYKDLRKRLMGSRHRPLQERKQTLAVFMSSRPQGETQRESMAMWNKQYRQWKYKEIRNFGRDVAAARRQLLNPGHLSATKFLKTVPGVKPIEDGKQ